MSFFPALRGEVGPVVLIFADEAAEKLTRSHLPSYKGLAESLADSTSNSVLASILRLAAAGRDPAEETDPWCADLDHLEGVVVVATEPVGSWIHLFKDAWSQRRAETAIAPPAWGVLMLTSDLPLDGVKEYLNTVALPREGDWRVVHSPSLSYEYKNEDHTMFVTRSGFCAAPTLIGLSRVRPLAQRIDPDSLGVYDLDVELDFPVEYRNVLKQTAGELADVCLSFGAPCVEAFSVGFGAKLLANAVVKRLEAAAAEEGRDEDPVPDCALLVMDRTFDLHVPVLTDPALASHVHILSSADSTSSKLVAIARARADRALGDAEASALAAAVVSKESSVSVNASALSMFEMRDDDANAAKSLHSYLLDIACCKQDAWRHGGRSGAYATPAASSKTSDDEPISLIANIVGALRTTQADLGIVERESASTSIAALASATASQFFTSLLTSETSSPKPNNINAALQRVRKLVVFVLGGITEHEVRELEAIGAREGLSVRAGGTHVADATTVATEARSGSMRASSFTAAPQTPSKVFATLFQ